MCGYLPCMLVCNSHVCIVFRSQKKLLDALELEVQTVVNCLARVLRTKLNPLQEQQELLIAELSLQHSSLL